MSKAAEAKRYKYIKIKKRQRKLKLFGEVRPLNKSKIQSLVPLMTGSKKYTDTLKYISSRPKDIRFRSNNMRYFVWVFTHLQKIRKQVRILSATTYTNCTDKLFGIKGRLRKLRISTKKINKRVYKNIKKVNSVIQKTNYQQNRQTLLTSITKLLRTNLKSNNSGAKKLKKKQPTQFVGLPNKHSVGLFKKDVRLQVLTDIGVLSKMTFIMKKMHKII